MAGLSQIRGAVQGVKNFLTPGTYIDGTPMSTEQDGLFGVDSMSAKPPVAGVNFAQQQAQHYQDLPTAGSTMGIHSPAPASSAPLQSPDIYLGGGQPPASPLPAQQAPLGPGLRDVKRL